MENTEVQAKLIENLEITKELIRKNVDADSQLWKIKYDIAKTKISKTYLVIGIILGVILLMNSSAIIKATNISYVPIVLLISVVCLVLFFYWLGKDQEKRTIQRKFEQKRNEIENLNKIIRQTFDECEKVSMVPNHYRNTHAVTKIIEYFKNQRADTLKEAINLYENEKQKSHQTNMLNNLVMQQTNMLKAQKNTNTQLLLTNLFLSTRNFR